MIRFHLKRFRLQVHCQRIRPQRAVIPIQERLPVPEGIQADAQETIRYLVQARFEGLGTGGKEAEESQQ
jgi:hypothetical protein